MKKFFLLTIFLFLVSPFYGQKIRAYLNANKISTDDVLALTVELSGGGGQVSTPAFPKIEGFANAGISTQQSYTSVNGQNYMVFSFVQSYVPQKAGVFTIPSFNYSAMGVNYTSPNFTIEVVKGNGNRQQQRQNRDPFADFYNDFFSNDPRRNQPQEKPKYQEVNADYFLAINLDKTECFVGEQISGEVVLYINERDFGKVQVESRAIVDMQQRIKNKDFWEEIIDMKQIPMARVAVNGKNYLGYTMYRTILFPLHSGQMGFKNVYLEGNKLFVATNLNPFDRMMGHGNKFEPIKIKAADKLVNVKELPHTTLPNATSVGKFTISAIPGKERIKTGEPLELKVTVRGNGNIALVPAPVVKVDPSFQAYDVTSNTTINKTENSLVGTKEFKYVFVPSEPGGFNLGPIKFYYFNAQAQQYDSLLVDYIPVKVDGENLTNLKLKSGTLDEFYKDNMERASTKYSLGILKNKKWIFLGFIASIGGFLGWAARRRHKKEEN